MTTEYVLADTGWDISETRLIELRITVVGMGDRIRVFGGSYELDPGRSCARCGRPVIPSCWRLRRRIGHPLVGYEDCTILCNECQRKAAERARLDGLI